MATCLRKLAWNFTNPWQVVQKLSISKLSKELDTTVGHNLVYAQKREEKCVPNVGNASERIPC